MSRRPLCWIVPLLILAATVALSGIVDMPVSRLFYNPATGFADNGLIRFFYKGCEYLSWTVGILVAGAYLLSFTRKQWKPWRKPALMLCLTGILGAGLLVHAVLKDHWGRPRPKQVVEFGGSQPFRPIYKPNFTAQPEPSKSFPCGHCTAGFFFFTLVFLGSRYHNRAVFYSGIALSALLGAAFALTRIAQGGHFLTDTIVTGVVMWLTAALCDWLVFGDED